MTHDVRLRDAAREALRGTIAAVDTAGRTTRLAASLLEAHDGGSLELFAVGKAAVTMAAGVLAVGTHHVTSGVVVTKEGSVSVDLPERLQVRHAAHPWPDERSAAAGDELLRRLAAVPADGLAVVCVSGGASALAVAPAWGVSLADKRAATRAVAATGAPIQELNALRKHLSRLKGGRLAAATRARVVGLVLSDVVGDDLATVGGGPLVADPTRFADALDVIARRGAAVPDGVRAALMAGAAGQRDETPKIGDPRLANTTVVQVAGPADLLAAAITVLERGGFHVHALPAVTTTVELLAEQLLERAAPIAAAVARDGVPRAVVAGGEPTVQLPAVTGRGGRAQHVALLAAVALARLRLPADVVLLAAGSDGSDGPTGDAGGLVDAGTVARATAAGVDVARAIAGFDAGTALAASGDLLTTGPTGTNLCDLYVVLARRAA